MTKRLSRFRGLYKKKRRFKAPTANPASIFIESAFRKRLSARYRNHFHRWSRAFPAIRSCFAENHCGHDIFDKGWE